MSKLLGAALEELTDFEHSKLLLTARTLFLRPGVMTRDYWAGAHKRYLGPVKLFITAFAVSLFVYSFVPSTAVFDLNTSIKNDATGSYAALVSKATAKSHVAAPVFIAEANERWRRYISWSQIIYPLVFALVLQLLFLNRHRYFAEHLVFALNYVTFSLLLGVFFWPLYAISGVKLSAAFGVVAALNAVGWFIYIFIALRVVYGGRRLVTGVRALVALSVYYVTFTFCVLCSLILAVIRTSRVLTSTH